MGKLGRLNIYNIFENKFIQVLITDLGLFEFVNGYWDSTKNDVGAKSFSNAFFRFNLKEKKDKKIIFLRFLSSISKV